LIESGLAWPQGNAPKNAFKRFFGKNAVFKTENAQDGKNYKRD